MKDQMSLELNKINLLILGKPNSGKSTLFNFLCKNELSPTGDEYGLTKKNYSSEFEFDKDNMTSKSRKNVHQSSH